ncbi:MAG: hypothetical protein EOM40_09515 [Clostridia bacterium]|nr:hypothetical protein [Clostridia bacterium]NCC42387.1 hypothetical protein [Clostridia bacterium]
MSGVFSGFSSSFFFSVSLFSVSLFSVFLSSVFLSSVPLSSVVSSLFRFGISTNTSFSLYHVSLD